MANAERDGRLSSRGSPGYLKGSVAACNGSMLWVRIQTSLKIHTCTTLATAWPANSIAHQKVYKKLF